MKHLLIIFTLLLTSVSWSENVDYDDLVTRDEIYYEKFSNKPFTGKTTGRIKGKIIDGKREGEILYFYDNGLLKIKTNYKYGKVEGKWLEYYESGQLHYEGNYIDGELNGEYLTYYENGQLEYKNYFIDTIPVGKQFNYYKNGKLKETKIWKDGKLITTKN